MPSNRASSALDAPVANRGKLLATVEEDQWFDRKSNRIKPAKLAESIAAFAHAEGGMVVVGISSGLVEGVDDVPTIVNDLRQASMDFLRPQVPVRVREVDCLNQHSLPDHLLVFEIEPSEFVHETVSGECFLRVGDENRRLSFSQRQELEFDRGMAAYEAQRLADRTFESLNPGLVESYRKAAGATQDARRLLAARGLLVGDFEPTVGCYLLFADQPQDLFPNAYVRVLRYLGNTRESGSRQALAADGDFRLEGPLPQQIHAAAELIDRQMPRRRALGADGLFDEQQIVPREAWLEALVNAVVHRSYSMGGDHVRFEIFDDRVEVTSPGLFPGLADLTRPLEAVRYARNPRIARVCFDLRITQELGEGIRRIFDEMRANGLADPVYEQGSGHVRVTLISRARIGERLMAQLPARGRDVLASLRGEGRAMRTGEVQSATGLSRPTVIKYLTLLQDAGLVEWSGANSSDKTATWRSTF